jgi:hypothetical protein
MSHANALCVIHLCQVLFSVWDEAPLETHLKKGALL